MFIDHGCSDKKQIIMVLVDEYVCIIVYGTEVKMNVFLWQVSGFLVTIVIFH
jgi:hypothetical protein